MTAPQATRQRVIRVFVSSTFEDMQAEREELVKRTFPVLRYLCAQRGVIWDEVDLRWGITNEQRAEGKVLPICLEDIRRCRPYFIGILGERYGWIPDEIAPALIKREPWLKEHTTKSVTELEILHGVLQNPAMAEHAYFYFRDPHYVDTVPARRRHRFRSDNPEHVSKLRALKDEIRRSRFPLKENYLDPRDLARLVEADLTLLVNSLFPKEDIPEPLDREAAEHESFARSHSEVYVSRKDDFDFLDAHANGDGLPLVVIGSSGSGKSALLANCTSQRREAHPEEFVHLHFIGSSPASATTAWIGNQDIHLAWMVSGFIAMAWVEAKHSGFNFPGGIDSNWTSC